ncbi:hypothetical protein H6G33_17310 [Calothrix sp. FACHB-1219]|uniref:hypothetical protein n=1 Tax=unclassified Calothrix TaxID=2619626 RepID=UPI001990E69A|nr:hypothetical protein [Calothrix sp. FACHB-1219]MBD2203192.1 hypothetical protein [Calothrix sp. FACHB-168]MBD2218792.1 hypothetical protein [Calothrix sp. FACHB-1219]
MDVGWVEERNPTPAWVTLSLTHPTNNYVSLLNQSFNLRDRFPIPNIPAKAIANTFYSDASDVDINCQSGLLYFATKLGRRLG